MPASRTFACLALLWASACDAEQASSPVSDVPPDVPAQVQATPEPTPVDAPDPSAPRSSPSPSPAEDDAKEPAADPTPAVPAPSLELRKAERATMLYDAADFSAAFRGKIARGETFHVREFVQGDPECKAGWARIGVAAFVCLGRSTVVEGPEPFPLPHIGGNGLTPFRYAKRRKGDHPAPVWRSRAALRRGADPVGELAPDHDYAFVRRRWANGERVLEDDTRRVVKEADVRRMIPSAFEGRDLLNEPLPSEGTLAWVVAWPKATKLEEAHPDAKSAGALTFQTTVVVDDAPVRKRGTVFYPLHDKSGWVEARAVRRLIPAAPPDDISDTAVWVDVEVTQQTLVLMRGTTPLFTTVISSGTGRNPTPLGLYRMESKLALTDMRSRAGDDDAYHVEAVPWAMYFDGRFALHGAYWHNRFGNRVSHGCINLAPKDAKRVFDALDPVLPNGWINVYEHEQDKGSLVRVRKGDKTPPDRRREPRRRNAK